MINRTAIQQWSNHAPWIDNAQIEQDLIICRALVSIFRSLAMSSLHRSWHFEEELLCINSICLLSHGIVKT